LPRLIDEFSEPVVEGILVSCTITTVRP